MQFGWVSALGPPLTEGFVVRAVVLVCLGCRSRNHRLGGFNDMVNFLTALGVGKAKIKGQHGWNQVRALFLACKCLPSTVSSCGREWGSGKMENEIEQPLWCLFL